MKYYIIPLHLVVTNTHTLSYTLFLLFSVQTIMYVALFVTRSRFNVFVSLFSLNQLNFIFFVFHIYFVSDLILFGFFGIMSLAFNVSISVFFLNRLKFFSEKSIQFDEYI
jgi:hypothetical protein